MELVYLDKENRSKVEQWNDFVSKSPQGSIFSRSWYLDALVVDYNLLCVVNNYDEILAGIILAKNQIKTYSNPLLAKYLGVLFKNEDKLTQKKVSKQYKTLELLSKELKKFKSFDYYFHPEFNNWIPFYWSKFTQQTRYTYQINLKYSFEEIEKRFHGNLKNDIKNALKMGVNIKRDIESLSFFEVINKTFKRQGSKSPFNRNKLMNFIELLSKKEHFVSFGAYNTVGELISVCGIVSDEKSTYFILNGIDIEKQVRGANALMIMEAIKFSKNRSLQIFDFEGSMLPGVEQFYRRFGGDLVPYYRIWNDNFFNYSKTVAKNIYKKIRYGR